MGMCVCEREKAPQKVFPLVPSKSMSTVKRENEKNEQQKSIKFSLFCFPQFSIICLFLPSNEWSNIQREKKNTFSLKLMYKLAHNTHSHSHAHIQSLFEWKMSAHYVTRANTTEIALEDCASVCGFAPKQPSSECMYTCAMHQCFIFQVFRANDKGESDRRETLEKSQTE